MTIKPRRRIVDLGMSYRSFIAAILAYLFIMSLGACFFYVPVALMGRSDFRHLYTAGYMVRTGYASQIYDSDTNLKLQTQLAGPLNIPLTFNHLAYEAPLFTVLSFVNFKSAYLFFFGINLVLVWACVEMLKPYLTNLRQIWTWLPAAILVCFYPITVALIQGQDSILMLTLFVAAFVAHRKGRDWWTGMFVGLTVFKFHFSIPFFVLFLAWRWWRSAGGFLVASISAAALSLWVAGLTGTAVYLKSLVSMSMGLKTAQQQDYYGIHPAGMPNLRGLIYAIANGHLPYMWVQLITVILSLLLLIVAARSRPSFPLGVLVTVLVSYHSLIHDTSLLVIPVALLGVVSVLECLPYSGWTASLASAILVLPTLLIQVPGIPWLLAVPVLALTIVHLKQLSTQKQPLVGLNTL